MSASPPSAASRIAGAPLLIGGYPGGATPPGGEEAAALLEAVREKSAEMGLSLNDSVTAIRPLRQGFHYLKKRITLTDSGRVIMRPQRDNVVRERRRIRGNVEAVVSGRKTPEAERQSWEGWRAHCLRLNAYRTVRDLEAYRMRLLKEAGLA